MSPSFWVFIALAFACVAVAPLLNRGLRKRIVSEKSYVLSTSLALGLCAMFVSLALGSPWPVNAAMFVFGVVCGALAGWRTLTILKGSGYIEMTDDRFVRKLLVSGPVGLVLGVLVLIRGGFWVTYGSKPPGWPQIQGCSLIIALYAVLAISSYGGLMVYLLVLHTAGRSPRKRQVLIQLNFLFALAPSASGLLLITLTREVLLGSTFSIFALMYTVVSTVASYFYFLYPTGGNQDSS